MPTAFRTPEADPPTPAISDELPAVWLWCDDDGTYWVPVDEEPDERRAWQRLEASINVAVMPTGRETPRVADCEFGHTCDDWDPEDLVYGPPCDAHPDCPTTPCPPAEPRDCWAFEGVARDDRWRAGAAYVWSIASEPTLPSATTSDG